MAGQIRQPPLQVLQPTTRESIENAMGLLVAHMQRDRASSQLLDALGGQACYTNPGRSGLSESDYFKLPLPQILREINRTPLPPELVQHFQRMRCQFQTGVFPGIQRAWAAVDSDLVIWNYHNGRDVVYYDGMDNVILAVDLVRPKANIFRNHVHYLLAVATASEVAVLGVTLAENAVTHDVELHFVNEPLYSQTVENFVVTQVKGSRNGRIFLGTQDGSLYEFSYFAQRGWLRSLCQLTNCSSRFPMLNNFLPAMFRTSDPVVEICIDDARHILYTLSDKGIISVYDLGADGQEMVYVASASEEVLLRPVPDCAPGQIKQIIHLESLPEDDAGPVHLVAFTQSGARLFITTCEPTSISGRPSILTVLHVRLPLALPHKITKISNGLILQSSSLMIDQQNENRHFLISIDSFSHFRRTNTFVETFSFMVVDRNIWSISPADAVGRRKTQSNMNLLRFVMVSPTGCQILSMLTPMEQLRQLLLENRGAIHDEAIKKFFTYYNYLEGCVMCLQLICNDDIDAQVTQWAMDAFKFFGGEPQVDLPIGLAQGSAGLAQPFTQIHPQETVGMMNRPPGQNTPHPLQGGGFQPGMSTPFRPAGQPNAFIPVSPINPPNWQGQTPQPFGPRMAQGQNAWQGSPQMGFNQPQPGRPDNNNLPGAAMLGSMNHTFIHSFRHDAIFVYLSRILRPVFESQLAKEAPPHAGEKPRLSLELTSSALTPVIAQLQNFKTFLRDLAQAPNAATGLRPQALSQTDVMRWQMHATIEEQNSMAHLFQLVSHTMEVLNLWKVVADHDIEAISKNMTTELFAYLKAITVKEFIVCDKQLLSALATSIVDSYLRDGAATTIVSGKLREFCPSIYGNEDAMYTEAFEMLMQAGQIRNERERQEILRQALDKCREVPVQALNLAMVCRLLDSARYYDGVLNICLWAAQSIDPTNLALGYVDRREPPEDDRGRRAYFARKEAYSHVTDVLNDLYRKSRQQDQPDDGTSSVVYQQRYDEFLAKCIECRDQLLHMCVFEWMMSCNQADKLINLRTAGLETFLRYKADADPTSSANLELLARHQEVNGRYDQAVRLWLQLGNWKGEMALDKRLTYLARASICAQSGAPNELLQHTAEALEVARIQADIARELPAQADALTMRLIPIAELYTEYAEKYDLAESQLRLLMCGEYDDPNLVSYLWVKLIDQEANKQNLVPALRRAVPQFKHSVRYFPLATIVNHCEFRAAEQGYDPLWLVQIFCAENGLPWHDLAAVYQDLYDRPETRPYRDRLMTTASRILLHIAQHLDEIPAAVFRVTVRNLLTQVDRYLVDTQAHITDANIRTINLELTQCRAVLERALEGPRQAA